MGACGVLANNIWSFASTGNGLKVLREKLRSLSRHPSPAPAALPLLPQVMLLSSLSRLYVVSSMTAGNPSLQYAWLYSLLMPFAFEGVHRADQLSVFPVEGAFQRASGGEFQAPDLSSIS
jgi:hypothetical protein